MSYSVLINLGTLIAVGAFVWYLLRQRRTDLDEGTVLPAEIGEPEDDAPET